MNVLLDECVPARLGRLLIGHSVQQDLTEFDIAVVLIRSRSNRLEDIRPLVPEILEAISRATKGQRPALVNHESKGRPVTFYVADPFSSIERMARIRVKCRIALHL